MKIIFILSFFISIVSFGQVVLPSVDIGSSLYDSLKATEQLDGHSLIFDAADFASSSDTQVVVMPSVYPEKAGGCDCYVAPDSTYTLAMGPNDDGSSGLINIPFNFCFYGVNYNNFYINNNGNITFDAILSAFSATAFPSTGNKIIAPFWGDVDTRLGFGEVWYKVTSTAVYINWVDVGYYNQHGDKRNTFQLIITDGVDPAVQGGNVAFCYQDMQWTTGDASGGTGGFGGTPATAGTNKGDGIAYFLISRFDHAGTDFDGALGSPDGISWLDYKSFYFDICNTVNIPPIPEGISLCDTFKVCSYGDTADISINFLSPEAGQITTITYSDGGLTSLQEISNVPGNTSALVLRIIGSPASAGTYTITVTATDDFIPAGVTTITFVIVIDDSLSSTLNPILTPLSGCDSVVVNVLNGPYDTYLWDDLLTDSFGIVDSSQVFGVTVSLNGCYVRVEEDFIVAEPPVFGFNNLNYCPSTNGLFLEFQDSLGLQNVSWSLVDPGLDSLYSNTLLAGTYSIHIEDSLAACANDTIITVVEFGSPLIFSDTAVCNYSYQVTGTIPAQGGTWSSTSASVVFGPTNTVDNPLISTANVSGNFEIIFTDSICGVRDTASLIFSVTPTFGLLGDLTYCDNVSGVHLMLADSATIDSVSWGLSDMSLDVLYQNTLPAGTYTMSAFDALNICSSDTTFTIEERISPSIFSDTILCSYDFFVTGSSSFSGGVWSSPNSEIQFDNPFAQNPRIFTDTVPGIYTVSFTDNECNITLTSEIDFPPYPGTWLIDTTLCDGLEYAIVAPDENNYPTSFVWNDGTIGTTLIVSQAGQYSVDVANVCYTGFASVNIEYERCDISVPNVISLAQGSQNPLWYVDAGGLKQFDLVITNRWGNLIYECSNSEGSCYWDGTDKRGNFVDEGTYFYIINAITKGEEEINKQGFIQVVK